MPAKRSKPIASKPKAGPGRPTKAQELAKAIEAVGVDPTLVDPRRVLASIAVDENSPATARVAAAKALMLAGGGKPGAAGAGEDDAVDEMTRRAVATLSGGRPN